ncbi:MAG: hypothetical protein WD851_02015 [Pirellulales bacterium]
MASPFSLFRKYMKPMMVVLCGMAMLAFVVVDPLMQYLGSSPQSGPVGRDGSKVAVTWNDGKLTEDELGALVYRRRILDAFVRSVAQAGYDAAYLEGAEDLQLAVDPLMLPIEPSQGVERDVVRTQIIADKARQLGMSVSDEVALGYLDKLGRNRVTFQEMNILLNEMFSQQRINSQFVIDALRDELLKQNFLASYKFTLATQLPQQRWEDWLQVNDRVIVEAAGLKPSNFIAEIKDPTDAEVLAFYDKYKGDEVTPDFPESTELPSAAPGFRVPRHLRLQYLEANYDAVLQQVMTTVTDAEIAKFYDENKELFIKADIGAAADPSPAPGAEPAPPAEPTDEATPADDAAEELFGTPQNPTPAEAPPDATPEAADENPPTEEPPTEEPMAPAEEPAAEEPMTPAEEPMAPGGEQSRGAALAGRFRLVAFQQEQAPEADAEEPAQEPVAEPAAQTEPAEQPADPPQTESAESASASDPPSADQPAALPAETTPPITEGEATAEATEEKPVEYQPLEEVRDEIRRRLAGDKVHEQLREKMDSLLSKLNAAYLPYFDKQLSARAEKQPEPEPPAELKDLQALAEPNGLKYHDTGDVSVWELRKLPVIQTVDANNEADPRLSLLELVLLRLKNYEPVVTRDLDGNYYLAMKTLDTPGYIPELDEVHDQVVQAWKQQKASELALAKAKELAAQIEKDGVTLGDKFANDPQVPVVVTDPFSWLTYGEISPTTGVVPFRLSDPKPVVAAGPEFMRAVFQLEEGNVGAVLNHDHSIAYIVRVQQHLDDRDTLRRDFLEEMSNGWIGANTMARRHGQIAGTFLLNGLTEDADVDWKRTPDQTVSEQTDEP